jgi:hypothetical protein
MNIITNLKINLHLEKYAVHLTNNEKQYLDVLMDKNPEVFTKIQQTVDEILSDGVVDLHDIPKIILLISQMYQANVLVEFVQHIRLLSLVKFTIDCLLDSGLLPIPQVEVVIIKRIVDTTIDLLSTNIDVVMIKTKKCRTWLHWVCCSNFDDDLTNDAFRCKGCSGCNHSSGCTRHGGCDESNSCTRYGGCGQCECDSRQCESCTRHGGCRP